MRRSAWTGCGNYECSAGFTSSICGTTNCGPRSSVLEDLGGTYNVPLIVGLPCGSVGNNVDSVAGEDVEDGVSGCVGPEPSGAAIDITASKIKDCYNIICGVGRNPLHCLVMHVGSTSPQDASSLSACPRSRSAAPSPSCQSAMLR